MKNAQSLYLEIWTDAAMSAVWEEKTAEKLALAAYSLVEKDGVSKSGMNYVHPDYDGTMEEVAFSYLYEKMYSKVKAWIRENPSHYLRKFDAEALEDVAELRFKALKRSVLRGEKGLTEDTEDLLMHYFHFGVDVEDMKGASSSQRELLEEIEPTFNWDWYAHIQELFLKRSRARWRAKQGLKAA